MRYLDFEVKYQFEFFLIYFLRLEVNKFPHKNMLICGKIIRWVQPNLMASVFDNQPLFVSAVNVTNENFILQKNKIPFYKST